MNFYLELCHLYATLEDRNIPVHVKESTCTKPTLAGASVGVPKFWCRSAVEEMTLRTKESVISIVSHFSVVWLWSVDLSWF